jgi:uncharacterized protein (UPF0332 family)
MYRFEKASECLRAAEIALENDLLPTAVNRSYYCIFHAMRAVLSLDSLDAKKHSGVISIFRQKYVKDGAFSVELSDIVERAFKMRNKSDYDDFYIIQKSDVSRQVTDARIFFAVIEAYVKQK